MKACGISGPGTGSDAEGDIVAEEANAAHED
jgi:hypothetical protein